VSGFLLHVVRAARERPLHRSDVVGAFAGLRPLLEAEGATADLSRKHAVLTSRSGVVTVVGGKLTTYRRMAEDAVDRAVSYAKLPARRSRTRKIPLVGAGPRPEGVPQRLAERYGSEAGPAHELVKAHPEEVGLGLTAGDLLWSVRHEGALDEGDLLDRRTRIGLVARDRDRALATTRDVLDRWGRV
jgi:glycerol-3-phosphate dehydrogenase